MKYNFQIQSEKQKQLDKYIKDALKYISDIDYWKKRIIALNVEINEVCNEIRFFKYWSKKLPSSKEVILDEIVDCLHFSFSLGNTLKNDNWKYDIKSARPIQEIYFDLSKKVFELENNQDINLFRNMLGCLVEIAVFMNYSMDDLSNAYNIKNKINYERQDTGY